MDLFTYLMAKKGHNTHRDLFSYLLGKNAGGSGTYTTFSGTSLNISNTLQAKIKNIALEGNTSQDGDPTPETPIPIKVVTGEQNVEIVGKNLFDKNNANIINAYINTSGKILSANNNNKVIYIKCAPNTTYTIQKMVQTTTANNRFRIGTSNVLPNINVTLDNYVWLTDGTTVTNYTYTTNSTANYLAIFIYYDTDVSTFQSMLDSIQIEKSSIPTSYEPYQSQNYSINLGKNLFDKDNMSVLNGYLWQNQMVLRDTLTDRIFYIPCQPNTTYTISRSVLTSSFRVATYNDTIPIVTSDRLTYTCYNEINNNNGTTITITTDNNTKYLLVMYANSVNDTNIEESLATIQIEQGSTATEYEPYFEPIELCKIGDYKDYIFKNVVGSPYYNADLDLNGWYLHNEINKVIFNGSEDWVYENSTATPTNRTVVRLRNEYVSNVYLSNRFVQDLTSSNRLIFGTRQQLPSIYISLDNSLTGIATSDSNITKLQKAKTYLSENNVLVYFDITPTNTKITDTTLITQLENLNNNARSYKGTTIIECTSESADNETIVFSGDIKVTSVGLGNSLNTSLLSSNLQNEEEQNDEPIEEEIEEPIEEEVS